MDIIAAGQRPPEQVTKSFSLMPWRSPSDFETTGEVTITFPELLKECGFFGHDAPAHQHPFRIKWIELRKYTSWLEYRHEFIIMACFPLSAPEDPTRKFFLRIDRAWDAPEGWRQYVPFEWLAETLFPRLGSSKPAANEVVVSTKPTGVEGTQPIARIALADVHVSSLEILPEAIFRQFTILLNSVGKYALFGANCWSVSRTMLVSTFYHWSEYQPVDIWLHGNRATYHAFRELFSKDVWASESMLPFHQTTLIRSGEFFPCALQLNGS